VEVGLFLNDVIEINNKDQNFMADLGLLLRWKDPRLARGPGGNSFEGCKLRPTQVWNPGFQFLNARGIKKTFESIKVDGEGTVTYVQRFYGEFSVPLDLRRFPFDNQLLWIIAGSIDYDVREMSLVVDQNWTGKRVTFTTPDWEFKPVNARVEDVKTPLDGVERSRFWYELRVRRYPGFFMWKIVFPLMLLVFMSWAVFWIDPKQLAPRITLTLVSMLNIVAYNYAISAFMPRISYLTLADKYIMGCMIIVFLALMSGITGSTLASRGKEALARRIDRISRWAFPTVFLLLIGVAFGT